MLLWHKKPFSFGGVIRRSELEQSELISRAVLCQLSCSCSYSHLPAPLQSKAPVFKSTRAAHGTAHPHFSASWEAPRSQSLISCTASEQFHSGNEYLSYSVLTFTISLGASSYVMLRSATTWGQRCLGPSTAHMNTSFLLLSQDLSSGHLEVWRGTAAQPRSHFAAPSRRLKPEHKKLHHEMSPRSWRFLQAIKFKSLNSLNSQKKGFHNKILQQKYLNIKHC